MEFDKIISTLYGLFISSPARALTTFLVIWTAYAIYYKLLVIGIHRSLDDMIMKTFYIEIEGSIRINKLSKKKVMHAPDVSADGYKWDVANIFLACFALRMMRITVISATALAIFSVLCIYVMTLAQPVNNISMDKVSEALGYGAGVFIIVYILTSLLKIFSAIHKMPLVFISKEKDFKIIFFSI